MAIAEFLGLPYAERQFIVLADKPMAEPAPLDWRSIRDRIRRAPRRRQTGVAVGIAAGVAGVVILPVGVVALAGAAAAGAGAMVWRRRQKDRAATYLAVAITPEQAEDLQFPVGHPRRRVLYAGHPVFPKNYLPVADFHRLLFEHKVAEALTLLAALGATEVEIHRETAKASASGFAANVDALAISQTISEVRTVKAVSEVQFKAILGRPTTHSAIPPDLVWYSHEPMWQQVAHMRMTQGLKSFSLDVRYEDDFGVTSDLALRARKVGLEIGGQFGEHQSTLWRMTGTFSN